MTPRDRKEWLAGLKVGDEVAIVLNDCEDYFYIRPIADVSRAGISWKSDVRSEQIGRVGSNGSISNRYGKARIEPVTDQHRETIRTRQNLARLRAVDWSKVSAADCQRIVELLDEDRSI